MHSDNHREGPMDALFTAVYRRRPAATVLIHSDQGSQFGSDDWRDSASLRTCNPEWAAEVTTGTMWWSNHSSPAWRTS